VTGASARDRRAALFLYSGAFAQGLVMVSFAATSAVLVERLGFSGARYGSLFLSQMVLAILGAVLGGTAARRAGLPRLLCWSFLGMAASQALLAGAAVAGPGGAYPIVLLGSGLMGFGSGLSAAPMNTYPRLLAPARAEAAVVLVHTLMGFGLATGPLLAAAAIEAGAWPAFPAALCVLSLPYAALSLRVTLPASAVDETASGGRPGRAIAVFVVVAFLYALVESMFSNWAVLYLHAEKGLALAAASLALSLFWTALAVGRVSAAAWLHRLGPERVYAALPLLMIAVLALMPAAATPIRAFVLFTIAGISCSAFYPLTVALAARRFPDRVPLVASLCYIALVSGIGFGTWGAGALHERFPLAGLYRASALLAFFAFVLGRVATGPGDRGAGAGRIGVEHGRATY
jgi:MFS family permease